MAVSLDASFCVYRAVIPHLAHDSSIVWLASIAAHRGSATHAHCAASKAALIGFGRSLALERVPRTRVNAVSPGVIETPMTGTLIARSGRDLRAATPMQRCCTPGDVALAIAFLCLPLARFISDETLLVSGGLYVA